ncbi:MAG: DNA mismatch endonuclease Vsr [Spirochaetia bacterium]|nr:DNA mismatch endonuclease Vsr [Spirochaetia bacterium]
MDTVSAEARSRMMAGIHGKDTKPERTIRSQLFHRGYRFRKNCPTLPGKPDIKLTKYRALVFVNGCFWHGHGCRYSKLPSSRSTFWEEKIRKNSMRDARDVRELRKKGWRVCIVWECALKAQGSRNASCPAIDALDEWIRGSEDFLELADPVSLEDHDDGTSTCSNPAMNHDFECFVAERSSFTFYNRK